MKCWLLILATATISGYALILVLHGSNGTADNIRQATQMDSLSDARGFVVAYPQGTNGGGLFPSDWNGGGCCGEAARTGKASSSQAGRPTKLVLSCAEAASRGTSVPT